ncbi:MAG: hypothetical protein WBM07_07710 [Chitinivibrionales bacterium]
MPFVILSFAAILLSYVLTTYGYFLSLNRLSGIHKISFSGSFAVVNTSSLIKYVPGKVWSYALQMYWFSKAGFSKSLILYINLINMLISLVTATIAGVICIVLSSCKIPLIFSIPPLLILLFFDILLIAYSSTVFNRLISAVNFLFKRNIHYYRTSRKLFAYLHLVHTFSALCFGIGAYFVCYGIGLNAGKQSMLPVMASMMISDVIGYIAFIVPGGLGVREGVMYFMLQGVSNAVFPLVLPIATRVVSMLADLCAGTISFILLKNLENKPE